MNIDQALARIRELLEQARDDRTCDERQSMPRHGCSDCERYLGKNSASARRTLRWAGFEEVRHEYPAALLVVQLGKALAACATCRDCRSHALVANTAADALLAFAETLGETVRADEKMEIEDYGKD